MFASSDIIAAQTIQVCYKLGRRIPEDMKLIGFDDVLVSSLTSPQISTIRQPIDEMAEMAVELLMKAADGKTVPKRTILGVSFIERETTSNE
ncbi:MAG: substrate-binding domain-containing protein [bacterium]|nr:substrate-binding domain-containing protein [bacterium]